MVLIEIQDTVKAPPAENKAMRKANLMGVSTRFGFYEPFQLIDFANVCIVVHLADTYQVYCQPIYTAVESWAAAQRPDSDFVVRQYHPFGVGRFSFSIFTLVWSTAFVVVTRSSPSCWPSSTTSDILDLLGMLGFWPLTVYFPVEMHIRQSKVKRSSWKWVALQGLSFMCFAATVGGTLTSVQGITRSVKNYVPF